MRGNAVLGGISLGRVDSWKRKADLCARIAGTCPAGERIRALGLRRLKFEHPAVRPAATRLHGVFGFLKDAGV